MEDLLRLGTVQATLSVVVLLLVSAIGFHVLRCLRGATNKNHTDADELIQNFEEMRREGDIGEAEFRTIASVLGKKPADEPERSGPTIA